MLVPSLIERKRDGESLPPDSWRELIAAYVRDEIPDYQMAALLMAVVWRGLSAGELTALTGAMLDSGSRLDFGRWDVPRVDKHSTGGIGDKVSLILAPLVASCGVAVPMMSGRGLGHTGGTVDKLESIPGFRTDLTLAAVRTQVQQLGLAMFAQGDEIAPADRKMYALRDVTGTVSSIPLIAASIMSKKLAEGLDGLVLDVKAGSGAFMTEPSQALELARTMVAIGDAHGCRTAAFITAMDRPLGRAIGNALEIEEALLALEGKGPDDLQLLVRAFAVEMMILSGSTTDRAVALRAIDGALQSGRALERFGQLIEAQGGDPRIIDDPGLLPQAAEVELFEAPDAGTVAAVDPRPLGHAVVEMGGGRRSLGAAIDHSVGFVVSARPGAKVARGEPIASVFARDAEGIAIGLAALRQAIRFGPMEPQLPLISHRVTPTGTELLAGA
jgi:pyrimidine-nucleoside phosphorylase